MIISIHQPNYFPWAGYFYKIMKSDIFVFLDDVQFSKNSFTNRANIIENKKKVWATLPVKNKIGTDISKIKIADEQWKNKHLSKIKNSYSKSIHFPELWEKINILINSINSNNLADINKNIIIGICDWLDFRTNFYTSSDLKFNSNLKAEEKLIEMIKYFNCNSYISGQGAKNYQDEAKFVKENIKLYYTNYNDNPYNQFTDNFITRISILDLLFNLGINSTKNYIQNSFGLL